MSGVPEQIGPYEILGELGRGGMGVVYRAHRADLGRDFALKLVLKSARLNESMMKRLEREAQAAARLAGHPGIVGVHDAGTHDDSVYLVMDFVEGRSLDHILRANEPLPPNEAAQLMAKVARAVQHAHDNHVLHRDIKPGNIMVTPEEQPRLTDFGLARSQQADHDVSRLTQSDEILGTPAYMPPEQACGEALDARADVYSLGATLYECLAGTPPFEGTSVVRVLTRVLHEAPRPLTDTAPGTPVDLQRIVSQCLAKSRDDRYPSAEALAADLDRFSRGDPVEARVVRRARSPMFAFVAAIAIFGTGAAVLGWALTQGRATNGPSQTDTATRAATAAERRTAIATAWRTMSRRAQKPFNQLLRVWFGAPGTLQDRAAFRTLIDEVATEVEAANPGAGSPQAWREMGRYLAGDEEGLSALRVLAAEQTADPFPQAVLALTLVVGYARKIDLPPPMFVGGKFLRTERRISAALQAARDDAANALRAMEAPDAWRGIAEGAELRDLAGGAHALAEERPHDAIPALEAAMSDPALRPLAQFLRGLAYSYGVDQSRAAADLEACTNAGWIVAASYASIAFCAGGMTAAQEGGDATRHFERALEVLATAESVSGVPSLYDATRVAVYRAWSSVRRASGASGRAELQRASDLLRSLARTQPSLLLDYGRALRDLAAVDFSEGRDGQAQLEQATQVLEYAIADFKARWEAEPVGPWGLQRERAREALGRTQSVLAQEQQRRGDPEHRTTFRRAIATLEALLKDAPQRSSIHGILADIHGRIALRSTGEAQSAAFRAGVHHGREFARLNPNTTTPKVELARLLANWGETDARAVPPPMERLQEALELVDAVIASQPREWGAWEVRATVNRLRAALNSDFDAALAQAQQSVTDARTAVRLSGNAGYPWQRLIESLRMYTAALARTGGDADGAFAAVVQEFEALTAVYPRAAQEPRMLHAVGEAAEFAGDFDAAVKWYRRVLAVTPQWTALARRVEQLEARKR